MNVVYTVWGKNLALLETLAVSCLSVKETSPNARIIIYCYRRIMREELVDKFLNVLVDEIKFISKMGHQKHFQCKLETIYDLSANYDKFIHLDVDTRVIKDLNEMPSPNGYIWLASQQHGNKHSKCVRKTLRVLSRRERGIASKLNYKDLQFRGCSCVVYFDKEKDRKKAKRFSSFLKKSIRIINAHPDRFPNPSDRDEIPITGAILDSYNFCNKINAKKRRLKGGQSRAKNVEN